MDASQPGSPNSAPRKHGAIVNWLLTDRPPKSVPGILATALAMWIPVLAAAFFDPDWYPRLLARLLIMLSFTAGFLSLAGLGRIWRDFRMAKTKAGKGAIVLAIVPLLAMAAITIFLSAVILIAMLRSPSA